MENKGVTILDEIRDIVIKAVREALEQGDCFVIETADKYYTPTKDNYIFGEDGITVYIPKSESYIFIGYEEIEDILTEKEFSRIFYLGGATLL